MAQLKYVDISKRTRKTVINTVDKLIKKYGIRAVKCILNKTFNERKLKENLEEAILRKTEELNSLKKRVDK